MKNIRNTLKLMSYPMYMLGHMVINNLVFQNIRNPFVIIKYMLESVDIDINGVAVPNEIKVERTFLVAMAINNLKLLNGSCSVGDVRIGEKIKVSSEFEKLLEKGGADERVIIWTDQRATNHYEAYSLAREKLMRVVDLVAFFANECCDMHEGTRYKTCNYINTYYVFDEGKTRKPFGFPSSRARSHGALPLVYASHINRQNAMLTFAFAYIISSTVQK